MHRRIGLGLVGCASLMLVGGCSGTGAAMTGGRMALNLAKKDTHLKIWLDGVPAEQNKLKKAATGYSSWRVKQTTTSPKLRFDIDDPARFGRITAVIVSIHQKFEADYSHQPEFQIVARSSDPQAQMKPGVEYDLGNPGADFKVLDLYGKEVPGVKLVDGMDYMLTLTVRADHSETAQVYFKASRGSADSAPRAAGALRTSDEQIRPTAREAEAEGAPGRVQAAEAAPGKARSEAQAERTTGAEMADQQAPGAPSPGADKPGQAESATDSKGRPAAKSYLSFKIDGKSAELTSGPDSPHTTQWEVKTPVDVRPSFEFDYDAKSDELGQIQLVIISVYERKGKEAGNIVATLIPRDPNDRERQFRPGRKYELTRPGKDFQVMSAGGEISDEFKLQPGKEYLIQVTINAEKQAHTANINVTTR